MRKCCQQFSTGLVQILRPIIGRNSAEGAMTFYFRFSEPNFAVVSTMKSRIRVRISSWGKAPLNSGVALPVVNRFPTGKA